MLVDRTTHSPTTYVEQVRLPPQKEVKLHSAEQAIRYIQNIAPIFLRKLEEIARRKQLKDGFQNIRYIPEQQIYTKTVVESGSPEAIFTAHNFCTIASIILVRALRMISAPNVKVTLITTYGNMFSENWGNPNYPKGFPTGHQLLKIADEFTTDYVDPTYGQIAHGYAIARQIAVFKDNSFANVYGYPNSIRPPIIDSDQFENTLLAQSLKGWGLQWKDLKELYELVMNPHK